MAQAHAHGPGPAMPGTKPGTDHLVDDGHDHPGEPVYIRVAIILAIVTAIEVAIYYVDAIRPFLVPTLLVLSVAKFVAVVGYFMHLKFDDIRFRLMFIAGMVIVMSVVGALIAMFWTDQYFPPPSVPAE
jgi:cytochrome c oxidase subunit 4